MSSAIIGSNRLAELAARRQAEALGYRSLVLSTYIEGEAGEVGRVAAALARGMLQAGDPFPPPACLILGGETTVTVRGMGRGGRNTELALSAAIALEGLPGWALMALATDGTDGPTDSAGGLVDGQTAAAARALGLDPQLALHNHDSYPLLDAAGGLMRTGPTGTNVNDLVVIVCR
ncbi:MAG: MOFRL family protein [Chloroflexota bacterium]